MKIEIHNGRIDRPRQRHRSRKASLYIAAGKIAADRQGARRLARRPRDRCEGARRRSGLDRSLGAPARARASSTRRRSNRKWRRPIAGGVTSLACPPDTDPPLDEPGLVEMLKHRARRLNQAHVYPVGALTVGLKGTALTEMGELAEAGCVAFSQADVPFVDTQVLLRAHAVRGDVRISRLVASAGSASRQRRRRARWRGGDAPWACRASRRLRRR